MKQRIQWIAAIMMAASAGLAFAGPGPGYYGLNTCPNSLYTEKIVRIEPVREMIVERQSCSFQRPLVVRESTCLMEPKTTTLRWSNPIHAVGGVISAPFIALGNAFSPSERVVAPVGERITLAPVGERITTTKFIRSKPLLLPVGERITKVTTYSKVTTHHKWSKKHHMKSLTYSKSSMLLPVGERITTVKYIHRKPMLLPVGERFTTVKVVRSSGWLEPVGERITTVRYVQQPMLMPVGERITVRKVFISQPRLEPVGERITTIRYMKPVLQPVGERTIIRTSRVFVQPLNSCSYSGFNPYW